MNIKTGNFAHLHAVSGQRQPVVMNTSLTHCLWLSYVRRIKTKLVPVAPSRRDDSMARQVRLR